MVGDAKGHLYDFLEVFGHKTKTETANVIIAAFDKAIQLMDEADEETDAAKISAVFPKVYQMLLDIHTNEVVLAPCRKIGSELHN